MGQEQKVTVRPQSWNMHAAELLALAEAAADLSALAAMVQLGEAYLFHVEDEAGDLLGAYVLRMDRGPFGPEGVVMSAAGRADFDLVANILPHVERQFCGAALVRFHTSRPGLIRKAAKQGYRPKEFVMVKDMRGLN